MNILSRVSTHNTTPAANREIKYIVIHFTAGTHSRQGAAINVAGWFKNQDNHGGSADFILDDANIVRYNPDPRSRYTWAVGGKKYPKSKGASLYGVCTNKNSISIELCSTSANGSVLPANDPGWSFTDAVIDRAVELTCYLMKEYGIDADHVIRHYDVSGKWCPGIRGWNAESGSEKAWLNFKARLTDSTVAAVPFLVRITTDVLRIRSGPGTNYTKVGRVVRGEAFTIVDVNGNWGKLKSGAGWIHLGYTKQLTGK